MTPERAAQIAGSFDLRALPPDFHDDPYPVYAKLRESEPVMRLPDGAFVAMGRGSLEAQLRARDRESARADLTNAQWNADQSEELFKAGAIPERDLRTAQQALQAAKARLAASEARLRASTQTASDTRILAPTTGVVATRTVEPGEHVGGVGGLCNGPAADRPGPGQTAARQAHRQATQHRPWRRHGVGGGF